MTFLFSKVFGVWPWMQDRVILEPACRHQSIEHTASPVLVALRLVLSFREGRILYGLIKNTDTIVLF